jgi:hypothetical protein
VAAAAIQDTMTEPRRLPQPWEVHEATESSCIRDANGQALAYVYFEDPSDTGMAVISFKAC